MQDAPTLLDIQGLKTFFDTDGGEVRAVDDLTVQIRQGQTLGLVGESGSGKSVTSLSIMRLLPEVSAQIAGGSVSFLGQDLVKLPDARMRKIRGRKISMIFQEPGTSLNPVFKTGKQVMEAIILHQQVSPVEARKRTIELFREVGIPEPQRRVDSYPHEMSGGQKQRVMIAMALSCNPQLLIADEPTTALDVTIQKQILDLIRKLRDERGMSVLFITHDLGVIAEIADHVAVMFRGRLVEYDSIDRILTEPQHPYTKGLLACRPRLDTTYKRLPTVSDFMEVRTKPDGDYEIIEKPVPPERLRELSERGRGRRLHPKSELAEIGHVWEEGHHAPDTRTVDEGERPILQVRNLKVYYPIKRGIFRHTVGHVQAVDGVSFNVYPGQTLGLVGESGCGKTTIGRAIMRLVEPTDGEILYDGADLLKLWPVAVCPECGYRVRGVGRERVAGPGGDWTWQDLISPKQLFGKVIWPSLRAFMEGLVDGLTSRVETISRLWTCPACRHRVLPSRLYNNLIASWGEREPYRLLRNMRRRIQIIFQDPYSSLNPRMTVENMLVEAMTVHRLGTSRNDRRDRAARLLEEVGLEPAHLRRYPHEFSGGQRQRISIARALAVEPEFIICDESVSALDVSVQAQVLNLLKDLQEERGLTYLFISHDLSVVKFMSDMMAVMNDGSFVEFGPSENIYNDPHEDYTRRLIAAIPDDSIENVRRRQEQREAARRKRMSLPA